MHLIRYSRSGRANSEVSQCDGKQPVCSRCAGYGHTCVWNTKGDSRNPHPAQREQLVSDRARIASESPLRKQLELIERYDKLVENVQSQLDEQERRAVGVTLSNLRQSVHAVTGVDIMSSSMSKGSTSDEPPSPVHGVAASSAQRYLGEASEIRFLNIMKQALGGASGSRSSLAPTTSESWDSYEQEEISRNTSHEQRPLLLPSRTKADEYLQIYFSTIHIAYPFVSQQIFMERYEEFWQTDTPHAYHGPWRSLLCEEHHRKWLTYTDVAVTIFALAACYHSFSQPGTDQASSGRPEHQLYFEQALHISQQYQAERTLDHICALLAQCFYLLATSEKDL